MSFFSLSRIYGQELPIMAYHGVQREYTSIENFKKLKDAGFNINFTIYKNNNEAQEALDCAADVGVKILLYTDELVQNPKATIARFKNHPALFGYYITDEPNAADFPLVKRRIDEIKKYDTVHPCYVNLYPNYATKEQMKSGSYADYLSKFTMDVPVDFISFDNYPLMNNKIRDDWYENLELIRKQSLVAQKKFWGFSNATVFGVYKQPTEAGLKLQMYSNLLYGAQGLQYFTYWTLDDEYWKKNKFGHSIVTSKGVPTVTYNIVKNVNEEIKKYSSIFLGSEVLSIFHTGVAPKATKNLAAVPQKFRYFSTDKPALVSYIKNKGKNYILVLNKDINSSLKLTIEPSQNLNYFEQSGKLKSVTSKTNFTVPAGNIIVFNY